MTPNAKLARALADAMSIEARIIHGQPMPGDYSKLSTLAHEIGEQAQKTAQRYMEVADFGEDAVDAEAHNA